MTLQLIAPVLACYWLSLSQAFAEKPIGLVETPPEGMRSVESSEGFLVPYTHTIPGTDITFEMVPVPGGVVQLAVHAEGQEPVYCEVELTPFWVGRYEVTWDEFRRYMDLDESYSQFAQLRTLQQTDQQRLQEVLPKESVLANALPLPESDKELVLAVDAVTAPTPLYDDSTAHESGNEGNLPAVTMSPFGARQYTKWLSQITGVDYRLPSEAEWQHAALAGESMAKELDEEQLDSVAWYTDNSDWVAHPGGEKDPNAWGLYDTLGNVAEMVLDAHVEEGRPELAGKRVDWQTAVAWPTKRSARVAKGSWWDADAEEVNIVNRFVSEEDEWKSADPNLPKSPWWYADYPTSGVGFRIVRPLRPIADELKRSVWDTTDEGIAADVDERLREGRGKVGYVGPSLPEAIEQLESPPVQKLLN